ncbi:MULTISPECIES: hypothetical protein [Vibrio]|nr:hypothetical protein [Vibrio pacinii]
MLAARCNTVPLVAEGKIDTNTTMVRARLRLSSEPDGNQMSGFKQANDEE